MRALARRSRSRESHLWNPSVCLSAYMKCIHLDTVGQAIVEAQCKIPANPRASTQLPTP